MTDQEREGRVGVYDSKDDNFWDRVASGSTIATEEDWVELMGSKAEAEEQLEE